MLTRPHPVRIPLTLPKRRRGRITRSSTACAVLCIACGGLVAPTVTAAQDAPVVTSMWVSRFESRPGDTYRRHDAIEAELRFDQAVTVEGAPTLALTIGSNTRLAAFDSGLSSYFEESVIFKYVVQQSDLDLDGISIASDAVRLNGATIRNADGADAALDLSDFTLTDDPALKVDGSNVGVQSAFFWRNGDADPIGVGERVTATLAFGDHVAVTGTPQLALVIGDETRLALYNGEVHRYTDQDSGQLVSYLDFHYDIDASDVDTEGVAFASDALRLNGGAIRDSLGADALVELGILGDDGASYFGVDGGVDNPPAVEYAYVRWPSSSSSPDTFELGEPIAALVDFTEYVTVSGTPSLGLTIGTQTRSASHVASSASRDGTATLRFVYDVQASDLDTDGLSIAADALVLNDGSIRDLGGTSAEVDLGDEAIDNDSGFMVDGRIDNPAELDVYAISRRPDDTLGRGERLRMAVGSSERVIVSGDPTLGLIVGDQVRRMEMYDSLDSAGYGSRLLFRYDVQESDLDEDGVSVAADALALNGGSIRSASGTDADLDLGGAAITDDTRYLVDGSLNAAPVAVAVGFSQRPGAGDTYRLGETIEAYVSFDKGVMLIGAPTLAITIGSQTRQMEYDEIFPSGVSLRFNYTVQASDRDADGIEIGSNALSLNGGAIRDDQGQDANLSLVDAGYGIRVHYKVDGSN